MSANRNASQVTLANQNAAVAQYNSYFNNAVNTGIARITPGGSRNVNASIITSINLGGLVVAPTIAPVVITPIPTLSCYYAYFVDVGDYNWVAPATVSTVNYYLIGAGGGGGGAYDYSGGGGGGGGMVVTGSYSVVPGQTYVVHVGQLGVGGLANRNGPNYEDAGDIGDGSSFDEQNNGPVAAGGGAGFNSRGGNPNTPRAAGGGGGQIVRYGGVIGGGTPPILAPFTDGGDGGGGGWSGGGGGSTTSDGGSGSAGLVAGGEGGVGVLLTFPDLNGGAPTLYGVGGTGGGTFQANAGSNGQNGLPNTGNGGGGGGAGSFSQGYGGNGGTGLVVLQYNA